MIGVSDLMLAPGLGSATAVARVPAGNQLTDVVEPVSHGLTVAAT